MSIIGLAFDAQWANDNKSPSDVTSLARAALLRQPDTQLEAQKLVQGMKVDYGSGVAAQVMIYNATGATMNLVDGSIKDYSGRIYNYPIDRTIRNGQWSVFLHQGGPGSVGSVSYQDCSGSGPTSGVWWIGWYCPFNGKNDGLCRVYRRDWLEAAGWGGSSWADDSTPDGAHENGPFKGIWNVSQESSPVFFFVCTRK